MYLIALYLSLYKAAIGTVSKFGTAELFMPRNPQSAPGFPSQTVCDGVF